MYISKKKTYKILACAMSAIFVGTINGGVASAEDNSASNNQVTMDENSITANAKTTTYDKITGNILAGRTGNKYGGNEFFTGGSSAFGDVFGNTMTVRKANLNNYEIIVAGSTVGNVFNNVSNFYDVENISFIDGGYAYDGNGDVYNNVLNFYSGTVGGLHGGHSHNGTSYGNTVNIYGGTIGEAGAGYSDLGNVEENHLNISDGVINGNAYGGLTSYNGSGGNGNAIGNYMNISGGTINGTIYGGWAPGGTASDNEINIYGNPNLVDAILIAGKGISDDAVSNNTLKIHTKNLTVYDIQGFENLNFYLPANTVNGDTILTVTNPNSTQKISNYIYVYKDEALNLNEDDTITLITTDDTTTGLNLGEIASTDENDSDYKNITKVYSSENPNIVQSLTINAKDISRITPSDENEENKMNPQPSSAQEESTIFNEPIADSVSLLDSGTDRLLEWIPPEGVDYMNSSPTAGFDPFIGIGGSKLEINTGNGTKLKTKNGGINFGLTRYLKNRHGVFIIAPLVDYGQDSYESTLNDENRTQGSGHSKYFMAGLIARQACVNGMYYEASLRGGKIKTDFQSNNFLVNNVPTTASYEASTPCYAGHLRIGWRNHISPKNILDVYGMYSLNHIKSFNTTVSTGENYSFSTVNSGRIRIGARLTRELKERESVYSGISFIHEFTGETTGEYMGMNTKRTGLKGSAGLIELGWQVKPAKNSVAMVDTSVSCWVGDRKGFIFAMKFKRDF